MAAASRQRSANSNWFSVVDISEGRLLHKPLRSSNCPNDSMVTSLGTGYLPMLRGPGVKFGGMVRKERAKDIFSRFLSSDFRSLSVPICVNRLMYSISELGKDSKAMYCE